MSLYECTTVGCTVGDCPNCRYVATLRNESTRLRAALVEIEEAKGRYSTDRLKHAENTISDMKALAWAALVVDDTFAPVGSSSVETHTK
jgi:hypothetical protein